MVSSRSERRRGVDLSFCSPEFAVRPLMSLLILSGALWGAPHALAATPPKQPESGPGGADYAASQVVKRAVGRASAATYVFHAAGEAAQPRPVVVMFHSWGAANPQFY